MLIHKFLGRGQSLIACASGSSSSGYCSSSSSSSSSSSNNHSKRGDDNNDEEDDSEDEGQTKTLAGSRPKRKLVPKKIFSLSVPGEGADGGREKKKARSASFDSSGGT